MKILSALLFCSFILLFACKEPIEGCTDPMAENYSSVAEVDDGTCTYLSTETSPCGEGINFCFEFGGTDKEGTAILSNSGSEWYIDWYGDTNVNENAGFIFSGDTAGLYQKDTMNLNDVHFFYYNDNDGYQSARSGSMTISAFDENDGVTGTFSFELYNDTLATNGNFFKLVK